MRRTDKHLAYLFALVVYFPLASILVLAAAAAMGG